MLVTRMNGIPYTLAYNNSIIANMDAFVQNCTVIIIRRTKTRVYR